MFVTVTHLHPSLIFANSTGAYPRKTSTELHKHPDLPVDIKTWVEVTNIDKHSSLLQNRIKYISKQFYGAGNSGLYNKMFYRRF